MHLTCGNANFDCSVSVALASFLHCKVTIFLLLISKYLIGRCFETMQISFLSSRHSPLILASISDFCLKQLLLKELSNGDFEFHYFFYTYLLAFHFKETLIHLLLYSCTASQTLIFYEL